MTESSFYLSIVPVQPSFLVITKKILESPLIFRPISLCNVVYKPLYKILANRLKPVILVLIIDTREAFVHDRSIYDNILVAHEVAHSMKR